MASFDFPTELEFRAFIKILKARKYKISKYIPPIDDSWYKNVTDCIEYVKQTNFYIKEESFYDLCSRILYKIAKRHELRDGNKRTAVIAVYLFCIINLEEFNIENPNLLKEQVKRIAKTKGRANEELLKNRVSEALKKIIEIIK